VPARVCVGQGRPVVGDLFEHPTRFCDEGFEGRRVRAVRSLGRPPGVVGLEGEAELSELLGGCAAEADQGGQG
jgi:hypothetical protein